MNIHAPLDHRAYNSRMWWVMLAGCAARFSAERSTADALTGLLLWALIFAACWVVRVRLDAAASPSRMQQAGNAVAILGMLLFLLKLNSDGLIPALLVFLFAIQAAVFVTASKRLHAQLILAAALGGVLFAAAESRSTWFLVCAVWFTFTALGLLALDHRRDRERVMLLRSVDPASTRTGGVAFACVALLCTIPLYLFVPKPTGLMLGGMQATAAHDYRSNTDASDSELPQQSDEPDNEVPDESSDESPEQPDNPTPARPEEGNYGENFSVDDVRRDKARGNAIVLYVKSSSAINLRGLVYDRFANNRWYRDTQPFQDYELERGNLEVAALPLGIEAVRQSIEVVRDLDATLVHAPGVRRLRFPGATVRRYDDDVFVVPQPLRAQTTYSIDSRLGFTNGRYMLARRSQGDLGRYLRADAASDRMRDLARQITSASPDARSKAFALENFLRSQYQYSYETIAQQGYTPLDWFLFEGKRGHCEYFASALAMLLRTVGIPARVATGFSLAAPNPVTGYYEVRALDGHAWVEAFIDGQWLMLEPTPFYPLPRVGADGQVADQLDGYLDRLAQTNELLDPRALKTQVARIARNAWQDARQVMRTITQVPRALGWILPAALVLGVLVSGVAYLAIMAIVDGLENRELRAALSRAVAGDARDATLLTAQVLQTATAPRGTERHAGASFREYLVTLVEAGYVVPAQFADSFDAARYGVDGSAVAMSDDAREVSRLIASEIAADPWPRVRRTVNTWRRWLHELARR
jgi:transglutaminase-like putative cysteine protease